MKCSFAKNSRKKNFAECQKNIEKEQKNDHYDIINYYFCALCYRMIF